MSQKIIAARRRRASEAMSDKFYSSDLARRVPALGSGAPAPVGYCTGVLASEAWPMLQRV